MSFSLYYLYLSHFLHFTVRILPLLTYISFLLDILSQISKSINANFLTLSAWRTSYLLWANYASFSLTCVKRTFRVNSLVNNMSSVLVGRQEEHPACKNWVVRYWHGYLAGTRCKRFAYGPADVTASPSSLAPVNTEWFTFLVLAYPGCLGKKPLNGCSSSTSLVNKYR